MNPRILVPYDFSPAAERALAWAGELQRATGGTMKVFHVIPSPSAAALALTPIPPPAPTEADLANAVQALHDVTARLAPAAVAAAKIAPSPEGGLMEEVRTWQPDLIVMGTHGRGGVKRLMLGSVADYLVRHAPCPVVTMRET